MNPQLLVENIRGVLIRLEETIIFALIERAQFARNEPTYQTEAFAGATGGRSLMTYLLHETECIHARMRRYTSPDERPFSDGLPAPILPTLGYEESPIRANTVNFNDRLLEVYVGEIVPCLCVSGDDGQYGSSSVCDVSCLQALSHRIHYGMLVAESKYRQAPAEFDAAVTTGDRDVLERMITHPQVEAALLKRVESKTRHHGWDLNGEIPGGKSGLGSGRASKVSPQTVVGLYRDWIIPLTKSVEVAYLLERR